MPLNKYKSIGITINTGNGIDKDFLAKILKQSLKLTPFVHMIAEKEGAEKHLHFQLWFEDGKTLGDIKTKYQRLCSKETWWSDNHKKYCVFTKICYNNWIEHYCEENEQKNGEATELIHEKSPENPYDFYPTEEEQDKALAKSVAVDKKFYQWAEDFKNSKFCKEEILLDDTCAFLFDMMFVSKKYQIIIDKKARVQNGECLYHYIRGQYSRSFMMTKDEADNQQLYHTNRERRNEAEKLKKEAENPANLTQIIWESSDEE